MVFNIVMRIVSTVLGLLMIALGGIWILQGLNIAFLHSFMAGEPKWAVYGAILALLYQGADALTHEDCHSRSLARRSGDGDVVHRRDAPTKSSGREWQPCGRLLAALRSVAASEG